MTSTTRIATVFASLQEAGHLAFMPFITAGDPGLAATSALITELGRRKVDLIEIGFPYSDPIADGPVIQASYTRALSHGVKVNDIFAMVAELPTDQLPPLVAMVSYALLFRRGVDAFVEQAAAAGFSGFIIPDLPADEAEDLGVRIQQRGLDMVQLIAPTTTHERAEKILNSASGFVYCISIAGTTGVRDQLPPELIGQLQWLRTRTSLPLAVGFGISRPEQVDVLRGAAEGVIVGSAIVRQLEGVSNTPASISEAVSRIGEYAAGMVAATHSRPDR